MNQQPRQVSRREALRRIGGAIAGGAILAASAKLLLRGAGEAASGQTCVNRSLCGACGAYDDCGLPAALSAKAAGAPRTSTTVNKVGPS